MARIRVGVCGALLALLIAGGSVSFAEEPRRDGGEPREALVKEYGRLIAEAQKHIQSLQLAEALHVLQRALAVCERIYPEKEYPRGHVDLVQSLDNVGYLLQATQGPAKALPYHKRALAMLERLYPEKEFPRGHPQVAISLNNLGQLLHAMGELPKALPYYERALAMRERLYPAKEFPRGHGEVAISLSNLGTLFEAMGEPRKALPFLQRALAMNSLLYPEKEFPRGHPHIAVSLNNLAQSLQTVGELRKALLHHQRAVAMFENLYPRGHLDTVVSLNNLAMVLQKIGEPRKAMSQLERAIAMCEHLPTKDFSRGQVIMAGTLHSLSSLLHEMGEARKALPPCERALAIRQRVYPEKDFPQGHFEIALSLNHMGFLLQEIGEPLKARRYYERSLAMRQRLYPEKKFPKGHPFVATGLNNMGALLEESEPRKALPYYEQALAMRQRLYPQETFPRGHPDLAHSLRTLSYVFYLIGELGKSQLYCERAQAMYERLYPREEFPRGNTKLVRSLNNMGITLQAARAAEKALPYHERALGIFRLQMDDVASYASEAEALAFAASHPFLRGMLLSASRHPADARVYAHVWDSKAALTRILQNRHFAARSASDRKANGAWQDLLDVRRQITRLLQVSTQDKAERDRLLRELTDRKEKLERDLAALLPELPRQRDLDRLGLDGLTRHLPDRSVFLDFLRYTALDFDPARPGKAGEKRILSYAVFVTAKDRPIRRVELGPADKIDRAVTAWREAIADWKAGIGPKAESDLLAEADRLGREVRRLVWEPIAKCLPEGELTVYLSPDGDLARLPWVALPNAKGKILLEEHLLAVVPHGPFLLERLLAKAPASDKEGRLLAVGGVAYDPPGAKPANKPYPSLTASADEMKGVIALAGNRPHTALAGNDATAARLLTELPKARYAHLATHGFFDEKSLSEERARLSKQMEGWEFQPGRTTERVGLGVRSPLSYTALVLAGANRPEKAGRDAGILSGEALVELPLENLRLAVLSACQTGLGDLTDGEGVQGLVRAFHLAGCPDVVASLWNVNDRATAALMTKFYHGLWIEGRPPAEALRRAQLLVYRRPDLLGDLAGERGAPKLKAAAAEDPSVPAPKRLEKGKPQRSPTKLWAAFFLSGKGS